MISENKEVDACRAVLLTTVPRSYPSHLSKYNQTSANTRYLESVFSQLALNLIIHRCRLLSLCELSSSSLLALVVCGTLNLSPLLQSILSPELVIMPTII